MNSDIKNHYLVKSINELVNNGKEISDSKIVSNFILELKMSRLFVPAIVEGEDLTFETLLLEETEQLYLPLFSTVEEFYKHYDEDSEYEPLSNEFEIYAGIAEDESIDGIVIDVEGICFEVPKDLIEFAQADFSVEFEDIDVRSPEEIRDVFEKASNEDLTEFIKDDSNRDDFEGIMVELSNANMLNLVVSYDSLDEYAHDGIISADDVDGFSLCVLEEDDERYAIMFSDRNALSMVTTDDELNYYGQLTRVGELFDFVLRNDMDGVVINPEGENFIIPRSELLSQASGIELIVEDYSFRNCLDYAFTL